MTEASLTAPTPADLATRPDALPLFTTEQVPGLRVVRTIGLVRGNTIRTRHFGHDIVAVFKGLLGGEIAEYTKMIAEAREQALDRMRAEAHARGANAVVCVRFASAQVMQTAAEILVYGTAVVVEPER